MELTVVTTYNWGYNPTYNLGNWVTPIRPFKGIIISRVISQFISGTSKYGLWSGRLGYRHPCTSLEPRDPDRNGLYAKLNYQPSLIRTLYLSHDYDGILIWGA